ncbi:MAG: ABC-type uncharacterized transport system involved in gliding motility auxiliary subunit [Gammaproteobacteria bacterium]|jgi:ABC-type uncharacterized transport system involved in gliding motility auxiliary subunit
MNISSSKRFQSRFNSGLFLVFFIIILGVLAWLSQQHRFSFDLSANNRNSLSSASVRLIKTIEAPMQITLFVSPAHQNRDLLKRLFKLYAGQSSYISFQALNPDLFPEKLREFDIRYDGEVVIEFEDRHETTSQFTESGITNLIQQLVRQQERWLVFLQTHGERDPFSEANHDYSLLAEKLAAQGYQIETLSLLDSSEIPDNTDVLVLANPQTELLPGEISRLEDYIDAGGSFLWLTEPSQTDNALEGLTDRLNVEFLPGTIIDPNSQLFGLDRADFALVSDYPRHPITAAIDSVGLFPASTAVEFFGADEFWDMKKLLLSSPKSWNETGPMQNELINGDHDDELQGPLTIGLTLASSHQDDQGRLFEQRVAVIGDADFLSNQYIGNGSNLDLGLNLVNWLSHDDSMISITPKPAPDTELKLSETQQLILALGFGLILPLLLFGNAARLWYRRRYL